MKRRKTACAVCDGPLAKPRNDGVRRCAVCEEQRQKKERQESLRKGKKP